MADGAANFRMLHTMIRVLDLDKSLAFYTGAMGMKVLRKREVPEGAVAIVEEGSVVARKRFATHPYVENDPLPAVRAPHEAVAAMQALAALYAA